MAFNVHCRYYIGQKPRVAVTDLDVLKQIMVKDFDNFSDRVVSELLASCKTILGRTGLHVTFAIR